MILLDILGPCYIFTVQLYPQAGSSGFLKWRMVLETKNLSIGYKMIVKNMDNKYIWLREKLLMEETKIIKKMVQLNINNE